MDVIKFKDKHHFSNLLLQQLIEIKIERLIKKQIHIKIKIQQNNKNIGCIIIEKQIYFVRPFFFNTQYTKVAKQKQKQKTKTKTKNKNKK